MFVSTWHNNDNYLSKANRETQLIPRVCSLMLPYEKTLAIALQMQVPPMRCSINYYYYNNQVSAPHMEH